MATTTHKHSMYGKRYVQTEKTGARYAIGVGWMALVHVCDTCAAKGVTVQGHRLQDLTLQDGVPGVPGTCGVTDQDLENLTVSA